MDSTLSPQQRYYIHTTTMIHTLEAINLAEAEATVVPRWSVHGDSGFTLLIPKRPRCHIFSRLEKFGISNVFRHYKEVKTTPTRTLSISDYISNWKHSTTPIIINPQDPYPNTLRMLSLPSSSWYTAKLPYESWPLLLFRRLVPWCSSAGAHLYAASRLP